jgi:hypothetical protein
MKQLVSPLLCLWLCAGGIVAPSTPAVAQGSSTNESSNVFGDIGRWFDRSMTSIGDQFKNAGKGIDSFNREAEIAAKTASGAAVDAADTVARLPKTRMVSGRQTCPITDNGAPDCGAAADLLCRARGLKSGTSVDVTSARECPTRALIQREARAECKNVTVVTRAMCQ